MKASRNPIWPKVPAAFVQQNLTGHKILGLAIAGLLYLICLSGTVTVFYLDLQRWETPNLPDVTAVSGAAVQRAVDDTRHRLNAQDGSIYVYAPTDDNPRLNITHGAEVRAYDGKGVYAGDGDHKLTNALTELHYYLLLPSSIGMIVVGLGGLVLLALILGGLLSHPRILKDAFTWRRQAQPRLERADLHNRIGVWAAPFHIAIALTGAVIGLSSLILLANAAVFHKGDTAAAAAPIYGPPPVEHHDGALAKNAIVTAYAELKARHADATPGYVAIDSPGSDHETLTITANIKDRLIYGEEFTFDRDGHLTGHLGLQDGAAGKQIYASLYKLHFGSFGGIWVRWAYLLLGAGLCLVCTTGMDIWLIKSAQKGKPCPRLHKAWTGFVWGAPLAMTWAGGLWFVAQLPFVPVFWSLMAALPLFSLAASSPARVSKIGRTATGASLLLLVVLHAVRFGAAAASPAGLWPNCVFLVVGLICLWPGRTRTA